MEKQNSFLCTSDFDPSMWNPRLKITLPLRTKKGVELEELDRTSFNLLMIAFKPLACDASDSVAGIRFFYNSEI